METLKQRSKTVPNYLFGMKLSINKNIVSDKSDSRIILSAEHEDKDVTTEVLVYVHNTYFKILYNIKISGYSDYCMLCSSGETFDLAFLKMKLLLQRVKLSDT